MECPNCNNIIPDDSRFCPDCGKEVMRKNSMTSRDSQKIIQEAINLRYSYRRGFNYYRRRADYTEIVRTDGTIDINNCKRIVDLKFYIITKDEKLKTLRVILSIIAICIILFVLFVVLVYSLPSSEIVNR